MPKDRKTFFMLFRHVNYLEFATKVGVSRKK